MKKQINYDGVEEFNLSQFCEESYLNYALYVIKDRVLPYIGDGLKPVQRRIIYTMANEGIFTSEKKKKSAYTVGQVLGRFHPHGDSACYEAMVAMVQDFTFRYPLISGQGNFGDLFNPKGFAAMRYTESYLSKYSQVLLSELKMGNTDWVDNYNGDEKEPSYLPARLPNILLNGTSGIAVGMATDIPPHNVGEVVEALCALIDNPSLSVSELMEYIPGPDYHNKAEIINSKEELLDIYNSGRGVIRQRAVWYKEKDKIIITELPFQSAPNLIVKIAELISSKKVAQIEDIRDDSSETETRVILQLSSSRVDAESLMNALFVYTDLEKTQKVNLNMIGINGKPQVKSLKNILTEWLEFRKDIVRKRFQHRLDKISIELNILEGFLIAFNNLEEVIKIVRNEDNPELVLRESFNLNKEQVTAILDLKIRRLSKLEENTLRKEEKALVSEQKQINQLLNSKKKFDTEIKKELIKAKEEFYQERRTPIIERKAAKEVVVSTNNIPNDPVFVVISKYGWIRCGKGHDFNLENLSYRKGDEYLTHCIGYANENVYLIDSEGQSYSLPAHSLPSMRGHGDAITTKLKLKDSAHIVTMLMGDLDRDVILSTTAGRGFITKLSNLETKNKSGKSLVNLKDNGELMPPILVPIADKKQVLNIFCLTNQGRGLIFNIKELPELNKGKGNKLIDIKSEDFNEGKDSLKSILCLTSQDTLTIRNGKRSTTIPSTTISKIKSSRGKRGKLIVKGVISNSTISINK